LQSSSAPPAGGRDAPVVLIFLKEAGPGMCKMRVINREKTLTSSPHGLAAQAILAVSLTSLALAGARAADAGNGERIAKSSCAVCHIVDSSTMRREVADAPPFVVIARKFHFNADRLVLYLLEAHPRMNFVLTRREASDVAAYVSTLRQ